MLKLNQLTSGQKDAWKKAVRTRENLLIVGKAGTGKSALLERILRDLRKQDRLVRVAAFTGLAAQGLKGTTLSRLLGVGLCKRVEDLSEKSYLDRARENLEGVSDIVVDEVSMISGDYIGMIDHVLREVTEEHEPFGGFRMIFSGDFMQLPPVRRDLDPEFRYKWAFEHPAFSTLSAENLSEAVRQENDRDVQILSDLRRGKITPRARIALSSMVGKKLPYPTELYPVNRTVQQVNAEKMALTPGKSHVYPTYYYPNHLAGEFASQVPVGSQVELKVGVPVIILVNEENGAYANGTQGVIVAMDMNQALVRLPTGRQVWVRRKVWEIRDGRGVTVGQVDGMPLHLGWAATIHRAQGMTLDSVKTDISRCWEPGQAYVAMTRTRSLSHISLTGLPRKFRVEEKCLEFMEKVESGLI